MQFLNEIQSPMFANEGVTEDDLQKIEFDTDDDIKYVSMRTWAG